MPESISLVNINSTENWFIFFCGLLLVEFLLLTSFRLFPNFWGNTINVWYDKFGLSAIMLDVLIVLIGFWITQWLYKKLFGDDKNSFKLWKFILLFLAVQIIHDFLFYFMIIRTSKGTNGIIDLMLNYGKKHGVLTVVGDSLMVILAILTTYGLLSLNLEFGSYMIITLLSLYFIGYLLYQRWN